MVSIGNYKNVELDVGIIRHMVLNTIRAINKKHRGTYGELVIACDDRNSWRREAFPYYKATRRKDRDASELDWGKLFDIIAQLRDELRESFPYRVLLVPGAEADDIIGFLGHRHGAAMERVLILSGDKDFKQLLTHFGVVQYDPVRNKSVQTPDPERFLLEHIIRGDKGDGIPSIFGRDSQIVMKERSRPIYETKLKQWLDMGEAAFVASLNEEEARNFSRNKLLIDLRNTPETVQTAIAAEYEAQGGKGKGRVFNYLFEHRLNNLMQSLSDF